MDRQGLQGAWRIPYITHDRQMTLALMHTNIRNTADPLIHPDRSEYEDTLERRERMMQAAKRVMAEVGFERATTAQIAHEAGASEAELLRDFAGKPALLETLFNAIWDPLNSRIADIVMASVSARLACMGILAAMLHVLNRDSDLARLLLFESRRQHGDNGDIRLSRGFRDFESLLVHVVERGQKDGSFTKVLEAPAIASALLGAAEGMVRDRLLAQMLDRPLPFNEAQLQITFAAIVGGLAP